MDGKEYGLMKKKKGLMTVLYEFWGGLSGGEIDYYYDHAEGLLAHLSGRVLEVGCGSGRVLVPLRKRGLPIEGLDPCPELTAICQGRLNQAGLDGVISCGGMADIEGKEEYVLIYSSLGTFQLIKCWEEAQSGLRRAYRALKEGGKLIIPLFLPFPRRFDTSNQWIICKDVQNRSNKTRFIEREKNIHDPVEQLIFSTQRFEVWMGTDCVEFSEKTLFLRWYSHFEFIQLLQNIGFRQVEVRRNFAEDEPPLSNLMLFEAQK